MWSYSIVCLLVAVTVSNGAPSTSAIGKKLGLCSRKAQEFDSCLTNRLQDLLPEIFKNGFPDLDIESSDPAYIKELRVQYNVGNFTGEMVTKNTKTYGLPGIQIHSVRSQLGDPKEFHMEADFTLPTVFIEGDYKTQISILGMALNSKGYFNISMENVTGTYDVNGEHITKKGEDYVRITRVNMLPRVGNMKIFASNLIPGNEELSQATVDFFNQNWRIAYDILLPVTNDAWSKYMADVLNLVFLRVPYKDLFPEA